MGALAMNCRACGKQIWDGPGFCRECREEIETMRQKIESGFKAYQSAPVAEREETEDDAIPV